MKRPMENCYWVIPGKLLAGAYPKIDKIKSLLQAGITVFINLTEECEGLCVYSRMIGPIAHQRFPIRDASVPESAQATKAILDAIDNHLSQGSVVYIHCHGGSGRTGTIVGCWLTRHGYEGRAALQRVQELWRHCPASAIWRSPNTIEQEQYILGWQEPVITRTMRYQGCLVGLAVGDAMGTAVEFKAPGTFPPVTDMQGGGPFSLKPGEWTDDTSMALCLADSLLACQGFDAQDQLQRYVRWWQEGYLSSNGRCFDIGATTLNSLRRYQRTGVPFAVVTASWSAGNGCLMRLAPVPLFFASDPERAILMSAESSRTTHGTRTCLDACRYFGGLINGAVSGVSKAELLSPRYAPVAGIWDREPLCPEIDEVASGSFKRREPPRIVGSGYVVESLEAALWAFSKSSTFEEGCLLAVNLGDDADTTAAIYGQVAGAHYGIEGIPLAWRERLAQFDLINDMAKALFASSDSPAGSGSLLESSNRRQVQR